MMKAFGILGFVFGLVAFVRLKKINKDPKRERNSRRGLQGGVPHSCCLI